MVQMVIRKVRKMRQILILLGLSGASSLLLLIFLNQLGVVAFTGTGGLAHGMACLMRYIGYSILFFIPVLAAFIYFCVRLTITLGKKPVTEHIEDVRYYNSGVEMTIGLFFAIGVLFTAWGMQNALLAALGNLSENEAARVGAWGILKRLVDNGILISLWTTIVGGGGGYLMRLCKYLFLGKALNRFMIRVRTAENDQVLAPLLQIQVGLERIERKISICSNTESL